MNHFRSRSSVFIEWGLKLGVFAIFGIATAANCTAMPQIRSWNHKSLTDESELIVVATPSGNAASEGTVKIRGYKSPMAKTRLSFNVDVVFKGDAIETLDLLYLQPKNLEINGLPAAHFRTSPVEIKYRGMSVRTVLPTRAKYLLYLKQVNKGEYELTTGKSAPILSVNELLSPIGEEFPKETETTDKKGASKKRN